MSKSYVVNLQYLYSEENIDSYVNNFINYKLGGFRKDEHGNEYKYLLNNKFGEGKNSYYALYLGAIDSAGKPPLGFFFNKSKQPAPEKRDDPKDVFDELKSVLLSKGNCKTKILFPYNITNIHWLTGEIDIDKKGDYVSVVIYTHNPYGSGQLSKKNFSILNANLYKIIEESGLKVTLITSLLSPFTNARQTMADNTSCGVIVADEVVKRITNSSLTITSPYPQGAGQLRLSQLTFLQDIFGEGNLNYQLFQKQVTLTAHVDDDAIPTIEASLSIGEVREKVEQVVSSEESNIIKIDQLKKIEENHYKPLIQQLAYKKSQEELKDLVIVLKDLGDLTAKLGELSGVLKYYNEAAIFYRYVIIILDGKLNENKNEFIKHYLVDPYQKISDIQQLIYSTIGGNQKNMAVVQEEAQSNKNLLLALRNKTDDDMKVIETRRQQIQIDSQQEKEKYQEFYVNAARELFGYITQYMKMFLAKLYGVTERQMTIAPPCKYAIVGLGSMALQQMTPYSDLEFAILTENEDYKKSDDPKIKEYFKNLTHLVNFKIINLGETIIPTSKYKLDMSHLVHIGVNFDLGGKTPLGRDDKPYELINTVDSMINVLLNEGNKSSNRDKNLPYILENVCYVHGDENLVKTYEDKVTQFLLSVSKEDQKNRLNCEIRAIKILQEGAIEFDYLHKTPHQKPKVTSYKSDLVKLKPYFFHTRIRLFDVKQEIYRLPDRMVYNLGLYYGIKGSSAWTTIDKLLDQGIITQRAAANLKYAVTFATTLRIKTYSHHKAQKNDMSIFATLGENESELKEQAKQIFHLSEVDLGEQGGLFQYFYTALPLHKKLKEFCDHNTDIYNSKQIFFQNTEFYEDDFTNKGLIHYRLANYKKARNNLEEAITYQNNQYYFEIRFILANIYISFGNTDKAIKLLENCLEIIKQIFQDERHPGVYLTLDTLGLAYRAKGQYNQAINYYEKSLNIKKLIYQDERHPDVAASLNHLGSAYYFKGQYDQAINYFEESLKIKKLIYQNEPCIEFAVTLNTLGLAYQAKGQYDQAISYYEEDLKITKFIYQDEPNHHVASSLNNLGVAYRAKGLYDQAINYYEESLKMKKLIYQDEPHPDVAGSLINIGLSYNDKGQYDQAINYYEKSLKIENLIYQDKCHPNVAGCLNNIGLAYKDNGQYDKAINYYEESLNIRKLIYQDKPHPDVAGSLNNLGVAYQAKGLYDQAIKFYEESLNIEKMIYQDKPHPDVASCLNNLGFVYKAKGLYDQAINCYEESLNIQKLIYQDEPHPDVVFPLSGLGSAYQAKGQYEKAMHYCEESLKMKKIIYQNKPHPSVANSLCSLGSVYYFQKKFDQAINYYEESLKMYKLFYKDKPHPNVSSSLNNLGSAYQAKGKNEQAIIYFEESLKINKLIYQDKPHPNVAACFNNLGSAYQAKGHYYKAINYYVESLKMYKLIYQDKPHPNVDTSLNNLGSAYQAKGQYDQAINYFEESLKMKKLIYQDEPHPCVADCLNNLGLAYQAEGQHDQAINYFEESIKMKKLIYQDEHHPSIAGSLNNLGLAYQAKERYDQAINNNKK